MRFEDFLRVQGLIPPMSIEPGRWVRCPTETHPRKKNGSFKLALDGLVGWCQNFETGEDVITWRPDAEIAPRQVDWAAIKRRQSEERREIIRATHKARDYYAGCSPLIGGHPYLDDHNLDMRGCHGLRLDGDGWMVVPMLLDNNLMSIQRISPTGEKKFWYNAAAKGTSYIIERPRATITVLCEGLATGLAIFAAAPLTRVVVAFNAGNMANVPIPPRGLVVVASDNDQRTICKRHQSESLTAPFEPFEQRPEWCRCNPGRVSSTEAAQKIGCGVAMPTNFKGTDWCDWRNETFLLRLTMERLGSKRPESAVARAVDAEIAAAISRNATYVFK